MHALCLVDESLMRGFLIGEIEQLNGQGGNVQLLRTLDQVEVELFFILYCNVLLFAERQRFILQRFAVIS